MIYPVLSIRQPWAALILLGFKDVENRNWALPERYTGVPVLPHASKAPRFDSHLMNREAHRCGMSILTRDARHVTQTGAILGIVIFSDCQTNSGNPYSRWCDKDSRYWWRIQTVRHLRRPILSSGRLRFWSLDLQPQ